MTKLKENRQYIMCIVVLTVICLFISAALAVVNRVTLPVITEANAIRAEEARIKVLPEADGFDEIQLDEKPESVTQIFRASNGAGYVVMMTVKGYGGNIEIICGIDANGCITQTKTLSHSETAGLGAKIDNDEFKGQFVGRDSGLEGVDTISGATISSTAYKNAIADAFTAYIMATEKSDNVNLQDSSEITGVVAAKEGKS